MPYALSSCIIELTVLSTISYKWHRWIVDLYSCKFSSWILSLIIRISLDFKWVELRSYLKFQGTLSLNLGRFRRLRRPAAGRLAATCLAITMNLRDDSDDHELTWVRPTWVRHDQCCQTVPSVIRLISRPVSPSRRTQSDSVRPEVPKESNYVRWLLK